MQSLMVLTFSKDFSINFPDLPLPDYVLEKNKDLFLPTNNIDQPKQEPFLLKSPISHAYP